jgi:uncharacterized protein (TIGR02246 family)
MKLLRIWVLAVALAGCSVKPAAVPERREAELRSLQAADEAIIRALSSRDADQIAAAYAPDATLLVANSRPLQGGEIKAALREMLADPNFSTRYDTVKVEIARSGEMGYTRRTYIRTMSDRQSKKLLTEKGKSLTLYVKQPDGGWKIVEDISNADAPAVEAVLRN